MNNGGQVSGNCVWGLTMKADLSDNRFFRESDIQGRTVNREREPVI